jgi:hypothetical protein
LIAFHLTIQDIIGYRLYIKLGIFSYKYLVVHRTSKTKVVICSKRKYRPEVKLTLDGIELDYTDAYLYLGVLFYYTGSVNFA